MHNIAYSVDKVSTWYKIGLHRFQILPILQVPSTAVRCIHKYKYRYRYMENIECAVIINFFIIITLKKLFHGYNNAQTTELVLV